MNPFDARRIDESAWYVKDTQENSLHGMDGGPFPYGSKAAACAAAANKNGRMGPRRYVVVTWLLGKEE